MRNACLVCDAALATALSVCPRCAEAGWEDGPHHLSGAELQLFLARLRGEITRLPNGFWNDAGGLERGAAMLRFAVTRIDGAHTRTAILAHATRATIERHKLASWLSMAWQLSVYDGFDRAFPDADLMPWEMPERVPHGFWATAPAQKAAAAFRWWLEGQGLTAAALAPLVVSRTAGVAQQLVAAGLGGLVHQYDLYTLCQMVDPTIGARPPSQRAVWRVQATIACPLCGRKVTELAIHRARKHPEIDRAAFAALLHGHAPATPAVRQRRRLGPSGPRGPRTAFWTASGLSLPGSWWPAGHRYAAVFVGQQAAYLVPLREPTEATVTLRRVGTRWLLRMAPATVAALRGHIQAEPRGDQVLLHVENEEHLMRFTIWSKGQHIISDLAILPSRGTMMIKSDLWPQTGVYAAVGLDADGHLGILPVTERGRVARRSGTGPGVLAPVEVAQCYKARPVGHRIMISCAAFMVANQVPTGAWTYVETTDDGFVVFQQRGVLDAEEAEEVAAIEADEG